MSFDNVPERTSISAKDNIVMYAGSKSNAYRVHAVVRNEANGNWNDRNFPSIFNQLVDNTTPYSHGTDCVMLDSSTLVVSDHTNTFDGVTEAGRATLVRYDADANSWTVLQQIENPFPAEYDHFSMRLTSARSTLNSSLAEKLVVASRRAAHVYQYDPDAGSLQFEQTLDFPTALDTSSEVPSIAASDRVLVAGLDAWTLDSGAGALAVARSEYAWPFTNTQSPTRSPTQSPTQGPTQSPTQSPTTPDELDSAGVRWVDFTDAARGGEATFGATGEGRGLAVAADGAWAVVVSEAGGVEVLHAPDAAGGFEHAQDIAADPSIEFPAAAVVALLGNTLAVGYPEETVGGQAKAGLVRVYHLNEETQLWGLHSELAPPSSYGAARMGLDLAVFANGGVAALGVPDNMEGSLFIWELDGGSGAYGLSYGYTYTRPLPKYRSSISARGGSVVLASSAQSNFILTMFRRDAVSGVWDKWANADVVSDVGGEYSGYRFGNDVFLIDEETVAVADYARDDGALAASGFVYIFSYAPDENAYVLQETLASPTGEADAQFGRRVQAVGSGAGLTLAVAGKSDVFTFHVHPALGTWVLVQEQALSAALGEATSGLRMGASTRGILVGSHLLAGGDGAVLLAPALVQVAPTQSPTRTAGFEPVTYAPLTLSDAKRLGDSEVAFNGAQALFDGTFLYMDSSSMHNDVSIVFKYSPADNTFVKHTELLQPDFPPSGTGAARDGLLVTAATSECDIQLFRMTASSYVELQSMNVCGGVRSSISASEITDDGAIFLGTNDGRLICLTSGDGGDTYATAFSLNLGDGDNILRSAMTSGNGFLDVATRTTVYRFEIGTGGVWSDTPVASASLPVEASPIVAVGIAQVHAGISAVSVDRRVSSGVYSWSVYSIAWDAPGGPALALRDSSTIDSRTSRIYGISSNGLGTVAINDYDGFSLFDVDPSGTWTARFDEFEDPVNVGAYGSEDSSPYLSSVFLSPDVIVLVTNRVLDDPIGDYASEPEYRGFVYWWGKEPVSGAPTSSPTQGPTDAPTREPTFAPSASPTDAPTTKSPTSAPTTKAPTPLGATASPTASPTTKAPTRNPTASPTTKAPTRNPTKAPTTEAPTPGPTQLPTTKAPTSAPTTKAPTPNGWTPYPTASPTTGAPTMGPIVSGTCPHGMMGVCEPGEICRYRAGNNPAEAVCEAAPSCSVHSDCTPFVFPNRLAYCNPSTGLCDDAHAESCGSIDQCAGLIARHEQSKRGAGTLIYNTATLVTEDTTKSRREAARVAEAVEAAPGPLLLYNPDLTLLALTRGSEGAVIASDALVAAFDSDADAVLASIARVTCGAAHAGSCLAVAERSPATGGSGRRLATDAAYLTVTISYDVLPSALSEMADSGTPFTDGSAFEQALAAETGLSTESISVTATDTNIFIEFIVATEGSETDPTDESDLEAVMEIRDALPGITAAVYDELELEVDEVGAANVDLCSGRTCNGRGACDQDTGACVCSNTDFWGLNCETAVTCLFGEKIEDQAYCACQFPRFGKRCDDALDTCACAAA